jgi:hypothetical protein
VFNPFLIGNPAVKESGDYRFDEGTTPQVRFNSVTVRAGKRPTPIL